MSGQVFFSKGLQQNVPIYLGTNSEDIIAFARNLAGNPLTGTAADTDPFGSIYVGDNLVGTRYLSMMSVDGILDTSSAEGSITTNAGIIYTKGTNGTAPRKITDGSSGQFLKMGSGGPEWASHGLTLTKMLWYKTASNSTIYPLAYYYGTSVPSSSYASNYGRFSTGYNTSGTRAGISPDGTIYINKIEVDASGGIKGTLQTSATGTGADTSNACIFTYTNQPLLDTILGDTYRNEDTKPASVKNVVEYVDAKIDGVTNMLNWGTW